MSEEKSRPVYKVIGVDKKKGMSMVTYAKKVESALNGLVEDKYKINIVDSHNAGLLVISVSFESMENEEQKQEGPSIPPNIQEVLTRLGSGVPMAVVHGQALLEAFKSNETPKALSFLSDLYRGTPEARREEALQLGIDGMLESISAEDANGVIADLETIASKHAAIHQEAKTDDCGQTSMIQTFIKLLKGKLQLRLQ